MPNHPPIDNKSSTAKESVPPTHNKHASDADSDTSGDDDKPATMAWLKKYMAKKKQKFEKKWKGANDRIIAEVEEGWKPKRPIVVETEQGLAVMTVAEAEKKGLKEKIFDRHDAQEEELRLPVRSKGGEGK